MHRTEFNESELKDIIKRAVKKENTSFAELIAKILTMQMLPEQVAERVLKLAMGIEMSYDYNIGDIVATKVNKLDNSYRLDRDLMVQHNLMQPETGYQEPDIEVEIYDIDHLLGIAHVKFMGIVSEEKGVEEFKDRLYVKSIFHRVGLDFPID